MIEQNINEKKSTDEQIPPSKENQELTDLLKVCLDFNPGPDHPARKLPETLLNKLGAKLKECQIEELKDKSPDEIDEIAAKVMEEELEQSMWESIDDVIKNKKVKLLRREPVQDGFFTLDLIEKEENTGNLLLVQPKKNIQKRKALSIGSPCIGKIRDKSKSKLKTRSGNSEKSYKKNQFNSMTPVQSKLSEEEKQARQEIKKDLNTSDLTIVRRMSSPNPNLKDSSKSRKLAQLSHPKQQAQINRPNPAVSEALCSLKLIFNCLEKLRKLVVFNLRLVNFKLNCLLLWIKDPPAEDDKKQFVRLLLMRTFQAHFLAVVNKQLIKVTLASTFSPEMISQ